MADHKVDCDCDACVAAKEMAEQAIVDNEQNKARTPEALKTEVALRLTEAPDSMQEAVSLLLLDPRPETWSPITHHLYELMEAPKHKFSGKAENSSIKVGMFNELKYEEKDLFKGTMLLDEEEIQVCLAPELKDEKKDWKDLIELESGVIGILVDIPMSFIYGKLTYPQAVRFVKHICAHYAEEYSLEKALARQMKPLTERHVKQLDEDIKVENDAISQAQDSIRDHAATAFEKRKTRDAIRDGQNAKLAVGELHKLLESGAYENFRIEDTHLVVIYKDISLYWEGYRYRLGDFQVSLNLTDGDLRITKPWPRHLSEKQKQRIMDVTHPHVNTEGRCCLDSYQKALTDLVMEQSYAEALLLIRQFLASYNPAHQFGEVHHFLPDHYYDIWTKDNSARPWENDDGLYHPGTDPTETSYGECYKDSVKNIAKTKKLRCLDKPLKEICDRCTFHRIDRDVMYEDCAKKATTSMCMKCQDVNCKHFPKAEDACLEEQKKKATRRKGPLGCLECPFERKDICRHGPAAKVDYE